jgi:hypothetical protein
LAAGADFLEDAAGLAALAAGFLAMDLAMDVVGLGKVCRFSQAPGWKRAKAGDKRARAGGVNGAPGEDDAPPAGALAQDAGQKRPAIKQRMTVAHGKTPPIHVQSSGHLEVAARAVASAAPTPPRTQSLSRASPTTTSGTDAARRPACPEGRSFAVGGRKRRSPRKVEVEKRRAPGLLGGL